MKAQDIKELAHLSIVDYSSNDVTSKILLSYTESTVRRLYSCMDAIGILSDKNKFVLFPDYTFSKNDYRIKAGITNGTLIKFETLGVPFIPLEFRPNCCGVIWGRINNLAYDQMTIQKMFQKITTSYSCNVSTTDFSRGNHFLGIYQCEATGLYYVVMHCSFDFVKRGSTNAPGLYIERTNHWNHMIKEIDSITYLIDDAAVAYYNSYLQHELHTKQLREEIVRYIFPDIEILGNETHEGFFDISTLIYGVYANNKSFSIPILNAPHTDLPVIEIDKKMNEIDLFCSPHGGGYSLINVNDGCFDENYNGFTISFKNNCKMVVSDIRSLESQFRIDTAQVWCNQYHFGIKKSQLSTIFNLKMNV